MCVCVRVLCIVQDFEAQREEIKNRNSEDYNVLKIQLEGIIEELERHFEQVMCATHIHTHIHTDGQTEVPASNVPIPRSRTHIAVGSVAEACLQITGPHVCVCVCVCGCVCVSYVGSQGVPRDHRAPHHSLQAAHT